MTIFLVNRRTGKCKNIEMCYCAARRAASLFDKRCLTAGGRLFRGVGGQPSNNLWTFRFLISVNFAKCIICFAFHHFHSLISKQIYSITCLK